MKNKIFLFLALLSVPVFGWLFWHFFSSPLTLETALQSSVETGKKVVEDFRTLPALAFSPTGNSYNIQDSKTDGIDISFASDTEEIKKQKEADKKNGLSLSFPKNYSEPLTIKLDDKRTIEITDLGGKSDYTVSTLGEDILSQSSPESLLGSSTSK
jgi:hypothetical protein